MKKIFTFIILAFLGLSGYSQCTPDDKYKDEEMGAYPTADEGLEKAEIDNPYEQVVSLVIPEKAENVTLEKAVIKDIKGLPDGFTYECGEPDCTYKPGFHCLIITGTAEQDQKGEYDLSILIDVYVGAPKALEYTYDGYKLEVIEPMSIDEKQSVTFGISQNSPNPFTNETSFAITSLTRNDLTFSVVDLVGKEVFSDNIQAVTGENTYKFTSKDLHKGIYLYRLSDGVNSFTKRMIIK